MQKEPGQAFWDVHIQEFGVCHELKQAMGQGLPHCSGTLRNPKTQNVKLVIQFVIHMIYYCAHGKLCSETVFANNLLKAGLLWEL